ncbi:MAG: biosynthetic peptidoglycan transglycosylase [Cyclonatronaceae bacterium]
MIIVLQILKIVFVLFVSWYLLCNIAMIYLKYYHPPISMVQLQKKIGDAARGKYFGIDVVYINDIPLDIQRIFIAAEDPNFFLHKGIDWKAIFIKWKKSREDKNKIVGASTITQQLIKNLFFTTHRSYFRKILELLLVYNTEIILKKNRIINIYLNIVEFDSGIYGIEAASNHYFGVETNKLSFDQAARLASVLPAPRIRDPHKMNMLSRDVLLRYSYIEW